MLTPQGVAPVGPKLTFTAGETVRGPIPDGSGAACLGGDPLEGAPTAQQTITRTLTPPGPTRRPPPTSPRRTRRRGRDAGVRRDRPCARHLRRAGTTGPGRSVEGVGDESTAVAVQTVAGGARTQHWVVLSRTGRALDVVDAQPQAKTALNVNTVTQALASTVAVQCGPAGGTCPTDHTTKDAPPPAGGDEPGFLTTGDLPPGARRRSLGRYAGRATERGLLGSQCESVNWSTTAATAKISGSTSCRTSPASSGSTRSPSPAATRPPPASWWRRSVRTGPAARSASSRPRSTSPPRSAASPRTGRRHRLDHRGRAEGGSTMTRFRVGIASSGDKVAFVFLNPQKGLDVTAADWNTVAVRAVQRATQQS